MTQVEKTITPVYTELVVLGHCNAGRINGFDLCCCAVSMLVFTIMAALSDMKLNNFKKQYGGGWCHIKFDNRSPDAESAEIAVNTVMSGFEMLCKSYPSNVCVSRRVLEKEEENE